MNAALVSDVDELSYREALPDLISRAGVATIAPEDLVPYIVDWLEDDSGPFGEGWDMFRQVAPVIEQGDVADHALEVAQLKAMLTDRLVARRLAWVLADVDGDVDALANYMRHWKDDPDMAPRGRAVIDTYRAARDSWVRALDDSDARSRAFGASVLAQLRMGGSPATAAERLLQAALDREDDAVAVAALTLALQPAGGAVSPSNDAVSRLAESGSVDPIWGADHPAFPSIVAEAKARLGRRG